MTKAKLVRIGGVWRRTSKGSGVQYLSGSVGVDEITLFRNEKILIFASKFKAQKNSPDFNMFVERSVEEEPPEEQPPDHDGIDGDGSGDTEDIPF